MERVPDHLAWIELSRRKLLSTPIFDLFVSSRSAADGRSGEFYLLGSPDWVNVVPVMRGAGGKDRFLMVRQHRHGIDAVTTEFPAGLVGRGETPLEAARRELAEETGRRAGRISLIGTCRPNPSFMDNWCYIYVAEDLAEAGETSLDPLEILDVVEVPAEDLDRSMGSGEFVNSLSILALLLYRTQGPSV